MWLHYMGSLTVFHSVLPFFCACFHYILPTDRLIMLLDVFGSVNTSLRHIQYLTIMSLYSLSVILWHKLSLRNVDFGCGNTNVELDRVLREYCETSCIASYVSCSDTNNNPDVLLVYNKGSSGCTTSFCLALQGLHELFR